MDAIPGQIWRFQGCGRVEVAAGIEVPVATTHRARLLGLALLKPAWPGAGLLIPHCRSVHTFGMRFALDVLFLDEAGGVLEVRRSLGPRRFASCRGAVAVLELPAGLSAPVAAQVCERR